MSDDHEREKLRRMVIHQQEEIERLQAALRHLAERLSYDVDHETTRHDADELLSIARAALAGEGET